MKANNYNKDFEELQIAVGEFLIALGRAFKGSMVGRFIFKSQRRTLIVYLICAVIALIYFTASAYMTYKHVFNI